MNFDWYGASIDAPVAETAGEALGAFDLSSWLPGKGRHGFNRAMRLQRGDTVLAEVMWENLGQPHWDGCFIQATGRQAAPLASWLREWQPRHRVARADVAEDYTCEGAWDLLSGKCLEVADRHGVKVEHAGDHHRAIDGRSIYLGGRSSVVREICYEKGKQIGGDPNHVRLELRVRPGTRDAKYHASQLTPAQLYGVSEWSADLASKLGHPDVERVSLGTVYREEDTLRSRHFLLKQYGSVLTKWQGEVGGWAELGAEIGRRLTES